MAHNKSLPWLMWFFPVTFFGAQFILRLVPGLVMPEFIVKFNISASDYGMFASLYYLGYSAMLIPFAFFLDKWGARKVISISVILCGASIWMLAICDCWPIALLSRFVCGVCSVVGLLGTSKVISQWFTKRQYGRMLALTCSAGILIGVYGVRPASVMIDRIGWENVFIQLGTGTVVLGILIYIFVRDISEEIMEQTSSVFVSLKKLLSYKALLLLALGNFLMVGALEGFADVWGIPYLMIARGISKSEALQFVSLIYLGIVIGGPILSYIAEKYKVHYALTVMSGVVMSVLLACLLLYSGLMPSLFIILTLFVIGVCCGYQIIIFSIGHDLVPHGLTTITIAFLNCINMLGGSFFHSILGLLVDHFEGGTIMNGVKVYSLESYTYALALIPICAMLGAFIIWKSKSVGFQENRSFELSVSK